MLQSGPGARAIAPRLGVILLAGLSVVFAANHIGARLAFDHGTSVPAAVAVRSAATAVAMLLLLRLGGVRLALARPTLARGLAIGALVGLQSWCLYSAVARIPVALALLAFNVYPLLLVVLTWARGGVRPPRRVFFAMSGALAGLVLALDVAGSLEHMAGRWAQIGAGVGLALGAALSFTLVLFFNSRYLGEVDARMRTLLTMGSAAVLTLAGGAATATLSLPADAQGWLGLALLTLFYGSAISATFAIVPRLAAPSGVAALNFEPVVAILLGWAVLGQAIAPLQMAGALIVVAAITLLGSGAARRR